MASSPRTSCSAPRCGRAWTAATPVATTSKEGSRPSTRSRSSARWGSPPISSWWRTSSCGRRTTASRSARAAQIITYGTIKAKAAIKDAARVLGHPYALGDRITKAFPPAVMGKDIPLSAIFDTDHPRHKETGELRSLYENEAEVKQVIDTARGIEGLIRQPGVHAAGVIMSAEPLTTTSRSGP